MQTEAEEQIDEIKPTEPEVIEEIQPQLTSKPKIKRSKIKIKRMKNLVEKGERNKHDVDVYFKCWKASLRFGNNNNLIRRLNTWYKDLWKGACDDEDCDQKH